MAAVVHQGPWAPRPPKRDGALRSWAVGHSLNRPTYRQLWSSAWPWLVVAGLLSYAGCWWGLAAPASVLIAVGLLGLRRPRR